MKRRTNTDNNNKGEEESKRVEEERGEEENKRVEEDRGEENVKAMISCLHMCVCTWVGLARISEYTAVTHLLDYRKAFLFSPTRCVCVCVCVRV